MRNTILHAAEVSGENFGFRWRASNSSKYVWKKKKSSTRIPDLQITYKNKSEYVEKADADPMTHGCIKAYQKYIYTNKKEY